MLQLPPHYNPLKLLSLLLLLAFVLSGCQWVQNWWQGDKEEPDPWSEAHVTYTVDFEGDIPSELLDKLKKTSKCVELETKKPPASFLALKRRVENDLKNLRDLLQTQGYFEAHVRSEIQGDDSPFHVVFYIDKRELYHISQIHLVSPLKEHIIELSDLKENRLKIGDPADSEKILKLKELLTVYLQEHGFPGPEVEDPVGHLNQKTKTLEVTLKYRAGLFSSFGGYEIHGLKTLDPAYVENRLCWKSGETYNQKRIDETRRKLMDSGIFHSVLIQPQDALSVPTSIKIQALEAPSRNIGMGVRYYSSEGWGVKGFWQHYNLWGGGQLLDTSLIISHLLKQFRASLSIPDVGAPEQMLIPSLTLAQDHTKAFKANTIETSLKLQRPLTKTIWGSLGVLYEKSHIRRVDQTQRESLWGVPLELNLDTTESPLNPEKGFRADLLVTPYFGPLGSEKHMTKTDISVSAYLPLSSDPDPFVLAFWTHLGSIFLKDPNRVPANKRFYSGGGGSVRAYGFQRLGPIDYNGLPVGGRSITEIGAEGRFHLTEKWGAVIFAEGGSVSQNQLPWGREKFFWGVGTGVRYFSVMGPIRFDIAFPASKRRKIGKKYIDSAFQFYFSVGQAF